FKVDKILVLSEDDKHNYNSFHKNVFLIKNPSPFEVKKDLKYNIESRTIISLGRLTHQKGYDLLLKAWAKIEDLYPEWNIEIYGDGNDLEKLLDIKDKLKLERIEFKGLTDNTPQVYEKASFFVMSSRFEGFGMVLIESHSFGLPTVSFNCPFGPSDIIEHEYNGLLIENGNIDKLAQGIERFILD